MKFKELLHNLDQFGYQVQISHNGHPHKTTVGGILTVLFNALFLAVFIKSFHDMFSFNNIQVVNHVSLSDYKEIGDLYFTRNESIPFYRFQ